MGLAAAGAWAQTPVNVIFLEPLGKVDTGGAEITRNNPLYRRVADTARYAAWLHNESGGITEEEVSRWQAERARAPFATPDDFRARQILAAARLAALHFKDGTRHP
jgi:hypothetical protein